MRLSTAVSEGWANVVAHAALSVILAVVSLVMCTLSIVVPAFEVAAIDGRQSELELAGVGVWVVTSDRGLSAAQCDRLATVDGVRSAGGILGRRFLQASTPDHRYLDVLEGTPGLAAVLWPGNSTSVSGTLVGGAIAAEYGLTTGSNLVVGATVVRVSVQHRSPRGAAYDDVMVVSRPPEGTVRECLVEAAPGHAAAVETVLAGWFEGGSTQITPFARPPRSGESPQEELQGRISLWYPLAGGAVVVAAAVLVWRIRRVEFALYRLLGARSAFFVTMLACEWFAVIALPACVGTVLSSTAMLRLSHSVVAVELFAVDVARFCAVLTVAPVLGAVLALSGRAVERIKGG